jgi:hypothetical protein
MNRRNSLSMILFALPGFAGGCASIPMGSPDDDVQAKGFPVSSEKANIYVYRHESFGFAFPMTVALDGRTAGKTVGQTYVRWEVSPGLHEIISYAEDVSAVKLTAEAGRTYYVWQEVKIGLWKARSLLHHVDEDTGRKGVIVCQLAKSDL